MRSGIDHVVHAVADLEAAASGYEALGFTVTPRADHPWGTANRLVQVDGSYIELLAVVDPEKLPEPTHGRFGFGEYNRRFLRNGEGLSMMVMATADAASTNARFVSAGIGGYERLDFSRLARQPDGTEATVSFSLAFADSPFPRLGLFACHHHTPGLVWQREYMRHRNGAERLAEIGVVADAPAAASFLHAATGLTPLQCRRGVALDAPGTRISLTSASEFSARWGAAAPVTPPLPAMAGIRFTTAAGHTPTVATVYGAVIVV